MYASSLAYDRLMETMFHKNTSETKKIVKI